MGLIIGGGLVFLLGTKTGKNLLKILSEQGLDGLAGILEEYGVGEDLEEEEYEEILEDEPKSNGHAPEVVLQKSEEKKAPKKRFFKRK